MGDTSQSGSGGVRKPMRHGRSSEGATGGINPYALRSGPQGGNRITSSAKPPTNTNSHQRSMFTEYRPSTSSFLPKRKSSTLHQVIKRKSVTARRLEMGRGDQDEDDDLAKAIALSLADVTASSTIPPATPNAKEQHDTEKSKVRLRPTNVADETMSASCSFSAAAQEQYDTEIAKATSWSLNDDDGPTPAIPSSSAAPQVKLESVHKDMKAAITQLEEVARQQNKIDPRMVATRITKWERDVFAAWFSLRASEEQRIRDTKEALALDRYIEQKHQGELEQSYDTWRAILAKKKETWELHMEKQKQKYEALLAEQNTTKSSAPKEEDRPSRNVASPSPPPHPAVSRSQEIETLKAHHAAAITLLKLNHASAIGVQKKIVDRLCDDKVELRRDIKAHKEARQMDKKKYEAQVAELKKKIEKLADEMHGTQIAELKKKAAKLTQENASLRREGLQVSGREGAIQTAFRSKSSSEIVKRKLDDGGEERSLESVRGSPKKAKNGFQE